MKVLVNISNHPSVNWSKEQKADFTNIYDIPFPNVDPRWNTNEVDDLAYDMKKQLINTLYRAGIGLHEDISIMLQGEFSLSYILKDFIREMYDWDFVIPTTEKIVIDVDLQGKKITKTKFVQWRTV